MVDDEEDILELVRLNLSKEGYQVHCDATGEAAIESIGTVQPNLMVLGPHAAGDGRLEGVGYRFNDAID